MMTSMSVLWIKLRLLLVKLRHVWSIVWRRLIRPLWQLILFEISTCWDDHQLYRNSFSTRLETSATRLLSEAYRVAYRDPTQRRRIQIGLSVCLLFIVSRINLEVSPEVYLQSLVPVVVDNENDRQQQQQQQLSNMLMDYDHSPPYVVFYHVFIPHTPRAAMAKAMRVMQEQITHIKNSYAVQSLIGTNKKLTIYYQIIGRQAPLPKPFVRGLCDNSSNHNKNIQCHSLGQSLNGFEELTLERLYEFCQAPANEHSKVIYIHSKGSYKNYGRVWYKRWFQRYSAEGENDVWRRHMMRAVFSQDCLVDQHPATAATAAAAENKSCDVCGLLFSPVWTFFFPGNFWTARCTHVRRLLSPTTFQHQMDTVVQPKLRQAWNDNGWLKSDLYPTNRSGYLGTNRYATEHWIAGHPDVQPCDMSPTTDLNHWRLQEDDKVLSFSMVPRFNTSLFHSDYYRLDHDLLNAIMSDSNRSKREYFLLPGYLIKFDALYGKAPEPSSWIWKWFPDGPFWKRAVEQHGTARRAIEVLLQEQQQQQQPERQSSN